MHTWTVTCDPTPAHAAGASGTAATEVDAVLAATTAMRRLVRETHHRGQEQPPFVNLVIDTRPRLGITAAPGNLEAALDRIDRYEYDATLAAAVDDSILGRLDLTADNTADTPTDDGRNDEQ